MEQLILVGVFLVVSILDALAKNAKKRKAQQQAEEMAGHGEDLEPWHAPEIDDPEGHDVVVASQGGDVDLRSRGSEGMIPKDLWEEIAALAGAQLPQQPEPAAEEEPEPEPSSWDPVPRVDREAVSLEVPARDLERESRELQLRRARPPVTERGQFTTTPMKRPEHAIHEAHALYGTDPSSRPPSEQDGMDPLAQHLGADPSAARVRLMGHDVHQLRQALILSEVLGPPVALKKPEDQRIGL